jgi:basic amino acid/polyamine antiporter, APA family
MHSGPSRSSEHYTGLARRLGLFDMTMLSMGSIIGTSIFIVPQVVAKNVSARVGWILAAWILGGAAAIVGAFISAELASTRPFAGGTYVYLRDAYHPGVAFLYGWCLLLVMQTGAMASVAVIFARYLNELAGTSIPESIITTVVIAVLSVINCLGVRTGSTVQNLLMACKIAAIGALIICGWVLAGSHWTGPPHTQSPAPQGLESLAGFGAAMVSVLFCYGGWQMAAFLAGEVRNPEVTVPRGLVMGVTGVIVLYLGVNAVCARSLGGALASTPAPASAVMRMALGERGAAIIAAGIAISALGYLSQATLTSPRVYYAMAADGLFFKSVAWLHPRTRVPIFAILLQGGCAIIIALSGRYHEILNYVMSVDTFFSLLTIGSIFIFRRRISQTARVQAFRVPGHPVTTVLLMTVYAGVAVSLFYKFPSNGLMGISIALTGVPVYFLWQRRKASKIAESLVPAIANAARDDWQGPVKQYPPR